MTMNIKHTGQSTLISSDNNASNFIYKIEEINDEQMAQINLQGEIHEKFDYLKKIGATCSFVEVVGETLRDNLLILDLGMARIIGECLYYYYSEGVSSMDELCRILTIQDPLGICHGGTHQPMYEYKLRQLLLAFALGMTVTTPWDGSFNTKDDYVMENDDGCIVCFHPWDRFDLEKFLFKHAEFETPSDSKHCFDEVYKEGVGYFIKLNLQISLK